MPLPPLHGSRAHAVAWLSHLGLDAGGFRPRQSPVFSENSFPEGRDELDELWATGGHISWLGGPAALTGEWPRSAAGSPLAHVATFHLADAHAAIGDPAERGWPEDAADLLPDHGYVQIFHDLETHGYDPADVDARGWLVTWHPDDPGITRPPLVDGDAASLPSDPVQPGVFMPGWTIPSPLDVDGLSAEAFAAADAAVDALDAAWVSARRPEHRHSHPSPSARLLGHRSAGERLPRQELLPAALPLCLDGDAHVLFAEIESWTTLNGWFGDAASLEVWMRASDLRALRFDRCWCLIRTD